MLQADSQGPSPTAQDLTVDALPCVVRAVGLAGPSVLKDACPAVPLSERSGLASAKLFRVQNVLVWPTPRALVGAS